jgi:hypothetical protein
LAQGTLVPSLAACSEPSISASSASFSPFQLWQFGSSEIGEYGEVRGCIQCNVEYRERCNQLHPNIKLDWQQDCTTDHFFQEKHCSVAFMDLRCKLSDQNDFLLFEFFPLLSQTLLIPSFLSILPNQTIKNMVGSKQNYYVY